MLDTRPYIFVSPRMMARVDEWPPAPEGMVTKRTSYGHHAFWAAQISYIPAISLSDVDAHLFGADANSRISWLLNRQIRFLYNLAEITNNSSTFELRYIADPRPGMEARVGIALLGKTFHDDPGTAERLALAQWERVSAFFPTEAPYSYPLLPATLPLDPPGTPAWERAGFFHWFTPIPDEEIVAGNYGLVEIRKFEDWPVYHVGIHDVDYIPHQFVPPVEYTGMVRLLEALSRQSRTACVAITLRPQRLAPSERIEIARFADYYARADAGLVERASSLSGPRSSAVPKGYEAYFQQRASRGKRVYQQLNEQADALFLLSIRVMAEQSMAPALTEAMGAELIANAAGASPSHCAAMTPEDAAEAEWARFNFRWLEMERWGVSREVVRHHHLARLRFFATPQEAVAAFRLPTAPPGASLAGVRVANEPFVAIPTELPAPDDAIGFGQVTQAGVPQGVKYRLPRRSLAGGLELLGDDSPSRIEVVAALLDYFVARDTPTIVIAQRDTPTATALLRRLNRSAAPAESEATGSGAFVEAPLFAPPDEAPAHRWAEYVARALALAFDLPTTICIPLEALLSPVLAVTSAPDGDALADSLARALTESDLSEQVQHLLTDQLLPGIRSLKNTPPVYIAAPVDASSQPVVVLSEPSSASHAGLARLALACVRSMLTLGAATHAAATAASPRTPPHTALFLTEAHSLFPARRSGDSPLLPLLDELRGTGCCVTLVTARPHLLDAQACASGVIAAQHLSLADAIAACQRLMRLKDHEASQLSTLAPGDTLWQRGGLLVLARQTPDASPRLNEPRLHSAQAPAAGGIE